MNNKENVVFEITTINDGDKILIYVDFSKYERKYAFCLISSYEDLNYFVNIKYALLDVIENKYSWFREDILIGHQLILYIETDETGEKFIVGIFDQYEDNTILFDDETTNEFINKFISIMNYLEEVYNDGKFCIDKLS